MSLSSSLMAPVPMVPHRMLPECVTLKANLSEFVDSFGRLVAIWSYPLLPAKAEEQRRENLSTALGMTMNGGRAS